jgi:hypothetical protein
MDKFTLTIYDAQEVPIGYYTVTNTNHAKGSSPITVTVNIPFWAFQGQATIYVNVLPNLPDNGGVPYSSEKTATFKII